MEELSCVIYNNISLKIVIYLKLQLKKYARFLEARQFLKKYLSEKAHSSIILKKNSILYLIFLI